MPTLLTVCVRFCFLFTRARVKKHCGPMCLTLVCEELDYKSIIGMKGGSGSTSGKLLTPWVNLTVTPKGELAQRRNYLPGKLCEPLCRFDGLLGLTLNPTCVSAVVFDRPENQSGHPYSDGWHHPKTAKQRRQRAAAVTGRSNDPPKRQVTAAYY